MHAVRSMMGFALVLASAGPATADPAVLLASRWPSVPQSHDLSLEDQLTDRLTDFGNELGRHLDVLSHDMFQLTVDGRHRQAHIRIGGGDADRLTLQIDGDIQFDDLNARIQTRLDLAVRGHALHLELPAFEMSPAECRGARGLEVRLPLVTQRF